MSHSGPRSGPYSNGVEKPIDRWCNLGRRKRAVKEFMFDSIIKMFFIN